MLILLECDRSFTRSDALAKHMRTVHETEALRPSDPVPRNYSSAHFRPQRLKLTVKPPAAEDGEAEVDEDATIYSKSDVDVEDNTQPFEYPPDVQFTEEELAMPPDKLFKLLRRQVHWAQEDEKLLQEEVHGLEAQRKKEWMEKELILSNLMEAELAFAVAVRERQGLSPGPKIIALSEDLPPMRLPMSGEEPWYRYNSDKGPMEGVETRHDEKDTVPAG